MPPLILRASYFRVGIAAKLRNLDKTRRSGSLRHGKHMGLWFVNGDIRNYNYYLDENQFEKEFIIGYYWFTGHGIFRIHDFLGDSEGWFDAPFFGGVFVGWLWIVNGPVACWACCFAVVFWVQSQNDTPLKINMEHNHGGLEDHFPFFSWVICRFHVNLPECNLFYFFLKADNGGHVPPANGHHQDWYMFTRNYLWTFTCHWRARKRFALQSIMCQWHPMTRIDYELTSLDHHLFELTCADCIFDVRANFGG